MSPSHELVRDVLLFPIQKKRSFFALTESPLSRENGKSMAFGSKAPRFYLWFLTPACQEILCKLLNFASPFPT